ncbi:MAG: hypothetical protein M3313_17415 [Actinomycetota bacterium]|nr:hypothetical protein [Actinomycetota bacterium]
MQRDDAQEVRPAARWVELRVHGVSGSPPEGMLLSAHVVQVGGDEKSRFFRPAGPQGQELPPDRGRVLEAYHWGRFTSGTWRQALWLLIIPFGVVNAAQFMLPRPGSVWGRRWHAVSGAMLRVLGVALTCLLIFSSAVVGMDVLGWQLAGAGHGAGRQWWLLVGLLLPLGALTLFGLFGRATLTAGQNPGEDIQSERRATTSVLGRAQDHPPTELGRAEFFTGDPDAPALRRLHAGAALAMLAVLVYSPAAGTGDSGAVLGRWLAITLLGSSIAVIAFLGDPERSATVTTGSRVWDRRVERWHRIAPVLGALQLVASLALLVWAVTLQAAQDASLVGFDDDCGDPEQLAATVSYCSLPAADAVAFGLLTVSVTALVLLFVAVGGLARCTRRTGPRAVLVAFARFGMGMTAALAASVGTFLGVGFAAAFSFAVQATVNRVAPEPVRIPPLLQRVAYAWGLTTILLLLLVSAGVVGYLARRAEFVDRAAEAFRFGGPMPRLSPAWLRRVGRAMYLARVKNHLQTLVWVLAGFGMVLSMAAGIEHCAVTSGSQCVPISLWQPLGVLSEPENPDGVSPMIWLGTLVLVGLSALLVFLGRGAIGSESVRRGVSVVWDVIAFWPRSAHPFVPPPYSQRAVADLRRRISWHLGTLQDPDVPRPNTPASRVVVAAHSQGSLIAVAALLWLTPEERSRVGLVTFGSQLRQQFVRAFPAHVDVSVLGWLWSRYGGRWTNLYRDTDPIAGPVLSWDHVPEVAGQRPQSRRINGWDRAYDDLVDETSGRRACGPDWRLLDPTPSDVAQMNSAVATLRGHGDYPADPDWPKAVAAVLPPLAAAPPTPQTREATHA